MFLNSYIIKALSNEKRLEIYNFIKERKVLIKSEILKQFNMNRAALDHHLDLLTKAKLVEILDININNRKYSFVIFKSDFLISLEEMSTSRISKHIPRKITEDVFHEITEKLWFLNDLESNDIVVFLSKIAEKLDLKAWELFCKQCRKNISIMRCSVCKKMICDKCGEIIRKTDQEQVIFCTSCLEKQFS